MDTWLSSSAQSHIENLEKIGVRFQDLLTPPRSPCAWEVVEPWPEKVWIKETTEEL